MSFLHRLRKGSRDSGDLPGPHHPTKQSKTDSTPPPPSSASPSSSPSSSLSSPSLSSSVSSSSSSIPMPNNQKSRQHKAAYHHEEEETELHQHPHVATIPARHKAGLHLAMRTLKEFDQFHDSSSRPRSKFHSQHELLITQGTEKTFSSAGSSSLEKGSPKAGLEELRSMRRQRSHDSKEEDPVGMGPTLPGWLARRLARVNTLSEAHAILQRSNTYAIKAVLRRPQSSDRDCTRPASSLETSDKYAEVDVSLLRLNLKPHPRYADLLKEIRRVHGADAVMKIRYLDNDGDEIKIVNDDSLCYAVHDWKRRTSKKRRLAPSLRIYLEEVAPDRQAASVSLTEF